MHNCASLVSNYLAAACRTLAAEDSPAEGVPADGSPAEGIPAGGSPAAGSPAVDIPAEGSPGCMPYCCCTGYCCRPAGEPKHKPCVNINH